MPFHPGPFGPHPVLASLDGLEKITGIGKDASGLNLCLRANAQLVSIAALGSVQGALPGGVVVFDHPVLVSLDGLEKITGISKNVDGYSLYLKANAELESIAALGSVHGALPGGVTIVDNPLLESLRGLENITGIGNDANALNPNVNINLKSFLQLIIIAK